MLLIFVLLIYLYSFNFVLLQKKYINLENMKD